MSNVKDNVKEGYFSKILFFWKNFGSFVSSEFSNKFQTVSEMKSNSIYLLFGGNEKLFDTVTLLLQTKYKLENQGTNGVEVADLVSPFVEKEEAIKLEINELILPVIKPIGMSVLIALFVLFLSFMITGEVGGVILSFPFLVPVCFLVLTCLRYHRLIDTISEEIVKYDLLKDSGLTLRNELKKPLFKWLNENMDGFKRGRIDNYLTDVYVAERVVEKDSFKYFAFKYTSVISKYKDKDGNNKYEYDNYNGVLLPCDGLGRLTISPDNKVKSDLKEWTTVSQDFNKRFNVWCEEELDASKLLSPAMVSQISELDKDIKQLNILISSSGDICLLFKQHFDVSKDKKHHSLRQPKDFLSMLESDDFSPVLSRCLEFLRKYMHKIDVEKPVFYERFMESLPKSLEVEDNIKTVKEKNTLFRAFSEIENKLVEFKKQQR